MKKLKDKIILIGIALLFFMSFVYSNELREAILDSTIMWFNKLFPSMILMYFIIDLAINYGLHELFRKIFKNDIPFIILLSLLSGTPGNAKYIKEFYEKGYISKSTSECLLASSYSPNPLFILAVVPNPNLRLFVFAYLYISNALIFLATYKTNDKEVHTPIELSRVSFVECMTSSIFKTVKVLLIVLGVVVIFGIVGEVFKILGIDNPIILSLLEMTNGIAAITNSNGSLSQILFSLIFAGLSIHIQIKSILEDSDISYKYFSYGRLVASTPIFVWIVLETFRLF